MRFGQTFGLVGESGCGKTTVGRLIAGLETANGGSLVVDGGGLLGSDPPGQVIGARICMGHVRGSGV
ncbi:MAG TPA: ATP-binding cassette domain-containing protein [Trebonia sp.]